MSESIRGPVAVLGRVLLCAIFLMDAVGNKIPHFGDVVKVMEKVAVPMPQFMLVGATVFLIVGSLSVIFGYATRVGAALLLVFLVLATFYFHDFWNLQEEAQKQQMIQFMKNLSMAGAMLFLIGNGPGTMSVDSWLAKRRAGAEASSSAHAPERMLA